MNNKYRVIDNFLPQEVFKGIQEYVLSSRMPWYFNDHIVYRDEKEKTDNHQYQFVHSLYMFDVPKGIGIDIIQPVLKELNVFTLLRAKINLTPIMSEQRHSQNHVDSGDFAENNIPYTVGVLYLNTNNGLTIFDDGTEIESIENRMLLFAGDLPHKGCSSTDDRRVVLNLNFINEETQKFY